MLLTRQTHKHHLPELNMASMVDVVFLLLIFFMCTSSFESPESNLAANLPQINPDAQSASDDFPPIRIDISMAGEGILISCDGIACPSFSGLRSLLKERRAIADIPVIIHGQADVPFEAMISALDASRQANLSQLAFWAEEL